MTQGVCIAVAKKIDSILQGGARGQGRNMATDFILGSRARRPQPARPCTPSPEAERRGSDGSGGAGGPAESPPTCGHRGAAPEQQQPRAAPHGREEPGGAGPGGAGGIRALSAVG